MSEPENPSQSYCMISGNYRSLPVFQLLELVLNEDVKILDFSKNRDWIESEEMNEFARILWKIVGERCNKLEKFIIPKELTYSSTLNSVIGRSIEDKGRNFFLVVKIPIFSSQWFVFDSADPKEEHSQQHVPARDRVPLPQPARARHSWRRSGYRLRNGE